jgi:3-deoxy-D-manno-octulosonic-acid transferase
LPAAIRCGESGLQSLHIRYRDHDQGAQASNSPASIRCREDRQPVAAFISNRTGLARVTAGLVARYIDAVFATSRVTTEPADLDAFAEAHKPFILAMWHGQFLMVPKICPRGFRIRCMVAKHGDAEMMARILGHFGMDLIRGAGGGERRKDKGGASALRNALRSLGDGYSVAMTADVPPGPARKAGMGIVTLARMSGRPIIPIALATSRYYAFRSWSRMTVNLPGGKLACVLGEPMTVSRDANEQELESARLAVEKSLNDVTRRAYALAGSDPIRATPPSAIEGSVPPVAPGLSLKIYRLLTGLAQPAAPLVLRMRARKGKEDPSRRRERLGYASIARPVGPLVWIHAASVGETNAVLPLLPALRERRPDLRFLLTTGTVTSAEIAARRLAPQDIHQYAPLDFADHVRRFLDHWQPDLGVFTESEIWPNLILESSARDIPLALINARMSDRSIQRWRRSGGISEPLFSRFDVVLAQNTRLARHFSDLGARRASSAGNLKIDAPPPPVDSGEARRLSGALGDRPHLIAASTHEGEDEMVAAAHHVLASSISGFCTIIAPRHPERGAKIADLLKSRGLSVARRSQSELPSPETNVYIADTIGELGTLYSVSNIAFIGGSLVNHGGQNPIEAVRHGNVVMTGPYCGNFHDAYRALLQHNGAFMVRSGEELGRVALHLLSNAIELKRMRAGATEALETLSGALQRTVEGLLPLLPGNEGLRRAS